MSEVDSNIRDRLASGRDKFLKLYALELLVRQVADGGKADIVAALKEVASKTVELGWTEDFRISCAISEALYYALENLPFVPGTHHRFAEDMFEAFKQASEEHTQYYAAQAAERAAAEAKSKKGIWSR